MFGQSKRASSSSVTMWSLTTIVLALIASSGPAAAQGRCIRAYGTPGCDTHPVTPVFDRTAWRTTALDHISFRVAEPQKEAAFYTALMGWQVRSDQDRHL
jgi:hypothetical protein